MTTISSPLETLTNQVEKSQIIEFIPDAITEDADDYIEREDYSISKSREVWRPYDVIKPKEGEVVIVQTKNSSFFCCKMVDGAPVRRKHGVDLPVAEPKAWIHAPYKDLNRYLGRDVNKDIPLEVAFVWLLREKHAIEDKLRRKDYSNDHDKNVQSLLSSFQRSESKNASLISVNTSLNEEIKQLQELVAQRNDELTKAEDEQEKCYAEIADLKHQITETSRNVKEPVELTRLRMKSKLDDENIEKLERKIQNLKNTEKQLRENAVQRDDELSAKIDTLKQRILDNGNAVERLAILEEEHRKTVSDYASLQKEMKAAITKSLNDDNTIETLRKNNKGYKKEVDDLKLKLQVKEKRPVCAVGVSSDSLQWISKYNVLSTRYTRLLRIFDDALKSLRSNCDTRDHFLHTLDETERSLVNFRDSKDNPTPVVKEEEEKPIPRVKRIPRSALLKIPHVGAGTIDTIAPVLKKFNVIIE